MGYDLDFESLKESLLSSIEHSVEEWQNKVKELLDENKSALAEMNEINEQLPQVQKTPRVRRQKNRYVHA
ncbi:hypothetical protein JT069_02260 [Helicobacter pylori]|nr:hypothetical protein [Helicobacter pylori]